MKPDVIHFLYDLRYQKYQQSLLVLLVLATCSVSSFLVGQICSITHRKAKRGPQVRV